MSSDNFYRAFEERYRGSRKLIQERLRVYLPYIQPLRTLHAHDAAAIDLGCGRGEWLELIETQGFKAHGVDLDEGMLSACQALHLQAFHADALSHLRTQPDASLALISGFHIAEHLDFEELQALIVESIRVLKPGGLLILETPNPENLVVGSNSFYLDPTHQRPLPPKLLSFLTEYYGYARTKILRLQESGDLLNSTHEIKLIDVLAGVSPDYAIISQKAAPTEEMRIFDAVFNTAHGIDLETLAQRFDEKFPLMQNEFIARIENQIDVKIFPLLQQIAHNEEHRRVIEVRIQAAEERARTLEKERDALRASLSWKVTAPIRKIAGWVMHPAQESQAAPHISQRILAPLMRGVLRHPRLSYRINQGLKRYPSVYQHLLTIARRSGVVIDLSANNPYGAFSNLQGSRGGSTLTAEARAIYAQLKAEARKNKEKR